LPLIISLHGGDVEKLPQQRPVYRWLLQRAWCRATAITACSAYLLAEATKLLPAPNTSLRSAIPNGVDVERFSQAAPYPAAKPYLLTAARLVEIKGVDLVIDGFAQIAARWPELELFIAGDGPLLNDYKALAAGLGMADRVHFLGRVAPDTMSSLMRGCKLFVLGSRQESFGIVLLEAMAAGKAVIATGVGGIPELVAHDQTGLLVPPENPSALAEAIDRLMADDQLRQQLGDSSRQAVREQFSWSRQGAQYEAIYQNARRY
jgi:glycosyltransferase involved in cell wall biosynthesis